MKEWNAAVNKLLSIIFEYSITDFYELIHTYMYIQKLYMKNQQNKTTSLGICVQVRVNVHTNFLV